MTDTKRAVQYIAIFINVGDNWRKFVPLDADIVTDHSVRLGTVEMGPGDNGEWWLKDLSTGLTRRYAKAPVRDAAVSS